MQHDDAGGNGLKLGGGGGQGNHDLQEDESVKLGTLINSDLQEVVSDTFGTRVVDTLGAETQSNLRHTEIARNDHTTIETKVSDTLDIQIDANLQGNGNMTSCLMHPGTAENDHATFETKVSDSLDTRVEGNMQGNAENDAGHLQSRH